MIFRVRTPFLTRNPYLFGDMTWGLMYVLHGLAGVGLIALITVHIYFALRPEKLVITKSMIFGWITPQALSGASRSRALARERRCVAASARQVHRKR